jgi:hypothetical protein
MTSVSNQIAAVSASMDAVSNFVVSVSNYVDSSKQARSYPLFIIDLNYRDLTTYYHLELKATTNNFAEGTSPLFYCGTSMNLDTDQVGIPYMDWCRIFVLGYDWSRDVRKWVSITNTMLFRNYSVDVPWKIAILVDPALLRQGQGDEWLREDNENLTWSFVRIDDNGPELWGGTTPSGYYPQKWNPVMPVKWYRSLPEWADQTPVDRPWDNPN